MPALHAFLSAAHRAPGSAPPMSRRVRPSGVAAIALGAVAWSAGSRAQDEALVLDEITVTAVAGDTDGDGSADFRIVLHGHVELTDDAFLL